MNVCVYLCVFGDEKVGGVSNIGKQIQLTYLPYCAMANDFGPYRE